MNEWKKVPDHTHLRLWNSSFIIRRQWHSGQITDTYYSRYRESCTHPLGVHSTGLALSKVFGLLKSKFLALLFPIESIANPLNLSCPMCLLKWDFINLSLENERSAVATVSGTLKTPWNGWCVRGPTYNSKAAKKSPSYMGPWQLLGPSAAAPVAPSIFMPVLLRSKSRNKHTSTLSRLHILTSELNVRTVSVSIVT